MREKIQLHPEIVEQKSVKQLSLLESALCGFQSLAMQYQWLKEYNLNMWNLPKRRLDLIKLILEAGVSTGAVAHMRLSKGPPSSVRQLSLDILEMTRQTRAEAQLPGLGPTALVHQQMQLEMDDSKAAPAESRPVVLNFSPENHQYWADMTKLIIVHTSPPTKRLLSKSKLWWARCRYKFAP